MKAIVLKKKGKREELHLIFQRAFNKIIALGIHGGNSTQNAQ